MQEEDGDRDGDVESHSVNQLLEQDDRQATEGESQKEDAASNLGEDTENGLVREGSQEFNADENDGLPPEIWTLILQYSTIQDPSTRYNMMRRLFYNTIRSMPLPEIYISPNLIRNVPRQVTYGNILE